MKIESFYLYNYVVYTKTYQHENFLDFCNKIPQCYSAGNFFSNKKNILFNLNNYMKKYDVGNSGFLFILYDDDNRIIQKENTLEFIVKLMMFNRCFYFDRLHKDIIIQNIVDIIMSQNYVYVEDTFEHKIIRNFFDRSDVVKTVLKNMDFIQESFQYRTSKRLKEKNKNWKEGCYKNRHFNYRHPKTLQEMKKSFDIVHDINENTTINIRNRGKRSACNLPTVYDDIFIKYKTSWKDRKKQRKAWMK